MEKNLITIAPNFSGKITAEFKSNNLIYKLNSLENLQVIDLKKIKLLKRLMNMDVINLNLVF